MNLWEQETLNKAQEHELKQVLALQGGRELLVWYQERIRHGYYVDQHRKHYIPHAEVLEHIQNPDRITSNPESLSDVANKQKARPDYIREFPKTLHLYTMQQEYNYYLKNNLPIDLPYDDSSVGPVYITKGIDDTKNYYLYSVCGNALVDYGGKYLALSTSARNITLHGLEMGKLYRQGIQRTFGTEYFVGDSHSAPLYQTVTMIPTKLFLEMSFVPEKRLLTGVEDIDKIILGYLSNEFQMLKFVNKSWCKLVQSLEPVVQLFEPLVLTRRMMEYFTINCYDNCVSWTIAMAASASEIGLDIENSCVYQWSNRKLLDNLNCRNQTIDFKFLQFDHPKVKEYSDRPMSVILTNVVEHIRDCRWMFSSLSASLFELCVDYEVDICKMLTGKHPEESDLVNGGTKEEILLFILLNTNYKNFVVNHLQDYFFYKLASQETIAKFVERFRIQDNYDINDVDEDDRRECFREAFLSKSLPVLKKAAELYGLPAYLSDVSRATSASVSVRDKEDCKYYSLMAMGSTLECLKWAHQTGFYFSFSSIKGGIQQNAPIENILYLSEHLGFEPLTGKGAELPTNNAELPTNNPELLGFETVGSDLCALAAQYGNVTVLEILHARGYRFDGLVASALESKQYDVILWALKNGYEKEIITVSCQPTHAKRRMASLGFTLKEVCFFPCNGRHAIAKRHPELPHLKEHVLSTDAESEEMFKPYYHENGYDYGCKRRKT